MPSQFNDAYFDRLVGAFLGSTEGTYYRQSSTSPVTDNRTKAVVSTEKSGLSFGATQLDVANNENAHDLFKSLLESAVAGGRITSVDASKYLQRASIKGLLGSPENFSKLELNFIKTQILDFGLGAIEAADRTRIRYNSDEIRDVINAVEARWGSLGVFGQTNQEYLLAIGHLASWSNRTNGLDSLKQYLTGGAGTGHEMPLPTLTAAPTYANIENYLRNQKQFWDNPGEFDEVTGRVERGPNMVSWFYVESIVLPEWIKSSLGTFENSEAQASPLILDLNKNGTIDLISLANSKAHFDVDRDGFAEKTGWAGPGDGLLAFDRNGDGQIRGSGELFGTKAEEGFGILAALDSNKDGKISAADANFSKLQVWTDMNGDGVSQNAELKTLAELSISSINLANTRIAQTVQGNLITNEGTFTYTNGAVGKVVDVWFTYDETNSVYDKPYTLDTRTLFLPAVRGYGELADLHVAMSIDNGASGLLSRVKTFSERSMSSIFRDLTLMNDIKAILFRWARVEDVNPTSRGANVDAQELAFMEKLTGRDFLQGGYESNPRVQAGKIMSQAFEDSAYAIFGRIALQSFAKTLFTGGTAYDFVTDGFGSLSALNTVTLSQIETDAAGFTDKLTYWENVLRVIIGVKGAAGITTADISALNAVIKGSDATLNYTTIHDHLFLDLTRGLTLTGDESTNTLTGTAKDDYIKGNGGNDTLDGSYGADIIYGDDGSDVLSGHVGDDLLYGGRGADIFKYNLNEGLDTIRETTRSEILDTIEFGAGIALSDLTFTRLSNNDLRISISAPGGTGDIVVEGQFGSGAGGVEIVKFSDSTTFDLVGNSYELIGSAVSDTLYGVTYGGQPNDILYGMDGNDRIYAAAGADTAYGGNHDDSIYGEGGDDKLYGDAGNDYVNGGAGNDVAYGGAGNDSIYGEDGEDKLYGDAGDDYVHGGAGNDIVDGGVGNDTLIGYTGNDTYMYGSGNDIVQESASSTGVDEIRFAAGITAANLTFTRMGNYVLKIDVAGKGSVTINDQFYGSTGSYAIETLRFADNTTINLLTKTYVTQGTAGNDTLNGIVSGGVNTDTLYGQDGNDYIAAALGNDVAYGGNGNDSIYGEDGDDKLYGDAGDDELSGGNGADLMNGGLGNDTMMGYAGNDIYVYSSGDDIVQENVSSTGVDEIRFAAGITAANLTFTRTGNYVLKIDVAGKGSVTVNDQFYGSTGGYAIETLRFADNTTINLLTKTYVTQGTAGNDTLNGIVSGGVNTDTFYGQDGNDYIAAALGNDVAYGGNGNDSIYGEDGDDKLYGDAGDDELSGGNGADLMNGGLGNDTMMGYAGNDIYVYSSGDDIVQENVSSTGVDEIRFAAGITAANLTFTRTGNYVLKIDVAGKGSVTVNDQFYGSTGGYAIETLRFADNTTINLLTKTYVTQGTAGNDTLNGIVSGGVNTDTFYGQDGNDYIAAALGNDVAYGGNGNDSIYGEDGDDKLYGDAGDDELSGGNGADLMNGGLGNDTMMGYAGNDIYVYSSGDDIVQENVSSTGVDEIRFAAGITAANLTFTRTGNYVLKIDVAGKGSVTVNDQFYGSTGGYAIETLRFADNTTINLLTKTYVTQGTAGNDTLNGIVSGGVNTDTFYGQDGNDYIAAALGNDVAYGGNGNDSIYGEDGDDKLYGDAGDDKLYGGNGADLMNGGLGNDTMMGYAGNDIYVYSSGDDIVQENVSSTGVDEIRFAAGITAANLTFTRMGNYVLKIDVAGKGSVTVNDQFYGSTGSYAIETLRFADNTTINLLTKTYVTQGTAGNDTLNGIVSGGVNTDTLYGQDGNDYIAAALGNDVAYGGNGNDSIYGEDGDDKLYGDAGDDYVHGGAGNDIVDGGVGNDTLIGYTGNDTYMYGSGNDIVQESASSTGVDEIRFAAGITAANLTFTRMGNYVLKIDVAGKGSVTVNDQFYGSTGGYAIETLRFADNTTINLLTKTYVTQGTAGNDTLNGIVSGGVNTDTFYGQDGNDYIAAALGNDVAYGGNGNDSIYGEDGDDKLYGDAGDDELSGGNGADLLDGGLGTDVLTGGSGLDTFVFDSALAGNIDTVADFSAVNDTIQLDRSIFAALTTLGTLSAAAFFAGATAHDADDRIIYNSAIGNLFYDSDGTGAKAAVQFARLSGAPPISNADFNVVA